jgi:hypothetical protein
MQNTIGLSPKPTRNSGDLKHFIIMKKLILNNLKAEQLSKPELQEINGGYQCSAYYCEFVNPNATCCGGGYQCSSYYCTFVNPSAACCY